MANTSSDARTAPPDTAEPLGGRWVWPPLILILTAALIWWLGREPQPASVAAPHATPAPTTAVAPLPGWPDLGAFFKKPLPSRIELNIPERGLEAKLLAFIATPTTSATTLSTSGSPRIAPPT